MKPLPSPLPLALVLTLAAWSAPLPARAEITMDGTMGPALSLSGPGYAITPDLGTQMGGNLFHSFGRFSIATGESATFSGPDSVTNIIARVTGGTPSTIDGLLRSTIPAANLFLLNPAGIIFGPGAQLDVSGSFHASTADYLHLGDGAVVYADPSLTSTLSADPPAAFGFLEREDYGQISNNSLLEVREGQAISLVGGEIITNRGTLYAPAGTITITAVASPGEATLAGDHTFTALGDITLTRQYRDYRAINGFYHPFGALDVSGRGGSGSIYIRGGNFTLQGGDIKASNYSDNHGGVIDIALTGQLNVTQDAAIVSSATSGAGDGNRVQIAVNSLNLGLEEQPYYTGTILSASEGWSTGKGGDIAITAESVAIQQYFDSPFYGLSRSGITTLTNGKSGGGDITIHAGRLDLGELGEIRTSATYSGDGGDIAITARDIAIANQAFGLHGSGIFSEGVSSGQGGDITIASDTLALTDSGLIHSSRPAGSGRGGDIVIDSDSILVSGANIYSVDATSDDFIRSGIGTVTSSDFSTGAAGDLTINTTSLRVEDAGTIFSQAKEDTWGQAGDIAINAKDVTVTGFRDYGGDNGMLQSNIGSATSGYLAAGDLTISTDSLVLADAGRINTNAWQADSSFGDAGNIAITANTIDISGYYQQPGFFPQVYQSGITSESFAKGKPGNIDINTNGLRIADAGVISTSAAKVYLWSSSAGDAGEITITAEDIAISGFYDNGSELYHSAILSDSWGSGDAGSIAIATTNLALTDLGTIRTNTWGEDNGTGGNGGDIIITSDTVAITGGYDGPEGPASSGIRSDTWCDGDAGSITLHTGALSLADAGSISTDTHAPGRGGDITLHTRTLHTASGALISSNTAGAGAAGDIAVTATDRIELEGSTIATAATAGSSGDGGTIALQAPDLLITDNAAIYAGVDAGASGNGGDIALSLSRLEMEQGAISAKSSGTGTAGDIAVLATDRIDLRRSTITTSALAGDGGNIEAQAGRMLYLDHGAITTSVQGGEGNGGNITLGSQYTILDHSRIVAQAYGGNGGNIHIRTETFIQDPASLISASSARGIDGDVTVDAPNVDVVGGMAILPSDFLKEVSLAANLCSARATDECSSLVLEGSDTPLPGQGAVR